MIRYVLISIAGLVGIIAVLGGVKAAQIGAMIEAGKAFVPPPESVTTAVAEAQKWTPMLRAVGTVAAQRGVVISTEVQGSVAKLRFESGARVKAGDLLVELDSSVERAQLASAEAKLRLAEVNLKRTKVLARQKVNTPADLDLAEAEEKQAHAEADNVRAQLAKKRIRAPFSGTLGIREVDLGQIMSPGEPIVALVDIDRVFIDFFLPQQDIARMAVGQTLEVVTDGRPDTVFEGKVETIEPRVDASTRNVKVRGAVDNRDQKLRPGMFVEVRVALPSQGPVVAIPATAILYAPYGNSVFVVEEAPEGEGKIARQAMVELGERRGDFVAVVSGLKPGQEVVSAGAFKLRNGSPVVVHNDKAFTPRLDPKPEDS